MKIKYSLFAVVLFSLNSYSAFNESESSQLESINTKSQKAVEETISFLNDAQYNKIRDNLEKEKLIHELRNAWDITIKKRCDLETVDSKGTDAEISAVNTCLIKGYRKEMGYFNNMLP